MEEKIPESEEDQKKEYEKFEREAEEEIAANSAAIEKLAEESPKQAADGHNENFFFNLRNLMALQQKNNDLSEQLKANKFDSNWRNFVVSFKKYMSDLMVAFKNFAPKSKPFQ